MENDELTPDASDKELNEEEIKSSNTFYSYGWICPVCGAGNAPFNLRCQCVNVNYKFTC